VGFQHERPADRLVADPHVDIPLRLEADAVALADEPPDRGRYARREHDVVRRRAPGRVDALAERMQSGDGDVLFAVAGLVACPPLFDGLDGRRWFTRRRVRRTTA